jgi:hypothetical protein
VRRGGQRDGDGRRFLAGRGAVETDPPLALERAHAFVEAPQAAHFTIERAAQRERDRISAGWHEQ